MYVKIIEKVSRAFHLNLQQITITYNIMVNILNMNGNFISTT